MLIAVLVLVVCVMAQEQDINRLKTQTITLSRNASRDKTARPRLWVLLESGGINTGKRPYLIDYGGFSIGGDDRWLRLEAGPAHGLGLLKDLGEMKWEEVDRMPALVLKPINAGISMTVIDGVRVVGPQGLIVRAIAGHVYAVHIKEDHTDYRVIFRID